MPLLTVVRTRVDAWLLTHWAAVVSAQDNYFMTHGRYFQGVWTHTTEPEYTDGGLEGDVPPDRADDTPTDQVHSWRDFLEAAIVAPVPARFKLDVYQNNREWGWVLSVALKHDGMIYVRSRNGAGSEDHRTMAWHTLPERTRQ